MAHCGLVVLFCEGQGTHLSLEGDFCMCDVILLLLVTLLSLLVCMNNHLVTIRIYE